MAAIDTGKTADFRQLQFSSIDEVLKEIDRIVEADRAGRLRRSGNWTAGQAFGHLATWINYAYEGFPKEAHPPWFIALILRMKKNSFLRKGMPRGVKIPGIKDGTLGTEPMSTEEGAKRLRAALMRMKNGEPVKFHSPAFGKMPDEDRIALQLRHAAGHMGFLHP